MLHLVMIVLGVQLLALIALRRAVWWYLGIDRRTKALEDIAESLRVLPAVSRYDNRSGRPPARSCWVGL